MLNHAMRTLIGFAARTAPPMSRQCSGPGNSSAARQQRDRAEREQEAEVAPRLGQQPPRRAEHRHAGEVRERVELRHPLAGIGQRAVEVVEARQPGVAVVGAVRVLAVQQALAGELDLVVRVVGEEPLLGRVAQRRLQRHGRQHEQHDRADDGGHDDPRPPAPHQQAGSDQRWRCPSPRAPPRCAGCRPPTRRRSPARAPPAGPRRSPAPGSNSPGGSVAMDGDDEDGEAEHRAEHRERLAAGERS